MFGYEDEAQKDQDAINKAKTLSVPEEEEIGWLWQKRGMLFFCKDIQNKDELRYVGAFRTKQNQFTRGNSKALLQGLAIKVRYVKGAMKEEWNIRKTKN